jgi:hypothetical protein
MVRGGRAGGRAGELAPPLGWPRVLGKEEGNGNGNERPGRGSLDRELFLSLFFCLF